MLHHCLTAYLCGGLWIASQVLGLAENQERPVLQLATPLRDFRLLHASSNEIAKRSENGECLVDVFGIVFGKGGSVAETSLIKVDGESTVKSVLEKCGVSCRNLWGTQVRLIKRNAILQSQKGIEGREKQIEEFEKAKVDAGDILIITTVI